MPQPPALRFLILASIFLGLILGGCAKEAALTLRTDPEPLATRLNLPKPLHAVRWVAVSPVRDTGWIPPKAEFYVVYAYIEVDDDAWIELEKTVGPSTPGSIMLPEAVATVLLPHAVIGEFEKLKDAYKSDGASFNSSALAVQPRTTVEKAVRVGGALVVQMTTY